MTETNETIRDLSTLPQNLRPLGIFALNRLLREVLREMQNGRVELLAPDRLSLTPVVFNKQDRTFHFAAVQGKGWHPSVDPISEFLGELLLNLADREDQIRSEMGALQSQYPYNDAVETLFRVIKAYSSDRNFRLGSDGPEFIEALHTVYYGLGTPRSHYLPGIFYNRLSDSSANGFEPIEWFSSGFAKLVKYEAPIYPGKFFGRGSLSLCEEEKDYFQESDRDAIVLEFIRKFHSEGQLSLNEHFETGPVLLLPVWDTWIDGRGFGGLWAVLICTFAGENARKGIEIKKSFEREVAPVLLQRCETISNALFNAGVVAISSEYLVPPYNLAEHFVRALTHVQDWEYVKAYYGDEIEFCYRRRDSSERQQLRRCEKPPCVYCNSATRRLTWQDHNVTLWDRRYVPELTEEDISQYHGYSFEFGFPKAGHVPSDSKSRVRFDRAALRQQMNVLGALAPRIRAQRYGLRRAVSGIMGRNMSHNIGSHVLARYASRIRTDVVAGEKADDQRSDLLQYLQRRMDFLADVATSDRAFWFQSLSLKEQIGRLNWDKQKKRFTDSNNQAEPALLRFIAGKEDLNATVKYSGDDVYFACPGGEVGVHALFVILENIIRNSARHGSARAKGDPVTLEVSFCEQDSNLLKLEIVDQHSPASVTAHRGEGEQRSVPKTVNDILEEPILASNGEPRAENWGIREAQICAHYLRHYSLYDLEGAPQSDFPILKAGATNDGKLKYTIYLHRAKRMAVIRKPHDDTNLKDDEDVEKKKLERQGIKIIEHGKQEKAATDWKAIGAEVGSYEYLVVESEYPTVESDFCELPDSPRARATASLPVRAFQLPRKKIDKLIEEAGKGGSQWLEPLHKHWAEAIRDRRKTWENRYLFGVSVHTSDGTLPKPACPWPGEEPGEALIFAQKEGSSEAAGTTPLPAAAKCWLKGLRRSERDGAIAAAWIDHAKPDDFNSGASGMGQSGDTTNTASRLWISAENARSGDPHARFLNDAHPFDAERQKPAWEILAAAVSRVAVLDERVQSAGVQASSVKDAVETLKLSKLWDYMGVWTPPKQSGDGGNGCNLDYPDFERCRKFLKKPAQRTDQYPIDVLVVHLTILERLARDCTRQLQKNFAEEPIQPDIHGVSCPMGRVAQVHHM